MKSIFSCEQWTSQNITYYNVYTGLLQIKELWKVALVFLSADVHPTVYRAEILRLKFNGGFCLTLDPLYRLLIASQCCTTAAIDKTLPIHVMLLILVQEIKSIISYWSGEFILIWAQKETRLSMDRTSVEIGWDPRNKLHAKLF